jgi:hypothetical protein
MPVPSAVAAAEQLADRLQQELIASRNTPEGEKPAEPVEPPTETPEPQQTGITPETPKPEDGSTPAPEAKPEDTVEHRYKVLQGKYNSEVPRLAAENKDLKASLKAIEEQLEMLKAAKAQEPLVKPEEIEEYGEGLIDVARRIAQEELAKKDAVINQMKAKLDSLEQVSTKTVEEDFFDGLAKAVPNWSAINDDARFHAWLDEVDELTSQRRQDLLSVAEKSRDAKRVAKFFTAFEKTTQARVATANTSLESQIAPASNKTPNAPPAKKVWTRGEISEFYSRMRKGEVSDAEAIAIESDIQAASLEGRVR